MLLSVGDNSVHTKSLRLSALAVWRGFRLAVFGTAL